MGNFITLNQDLLTSHSGVSSRGLSILEKGIEAVPGMRRQEAPLAALPAQAQQHVAACFLTVFSRSPLIWWELRSFSFIFKKAVCEWKCILRPYSKKTLLAILCQDAEASMCIYETQIFASHISQLFTDYMIRMYIEPFIFVWIGKWYLEMLWFLKKILFN